MATKSMRAKTTCEKLEKIPVEKRVIEFVPGTWEPTGEHAQHFISYCNMKAKETIPCNVASWDKVDDGLKTGLWNVIKVLCLML